MSEKETCTVREKVAEQLYKQSRNEYIGIIEHTSYLVLIRTILID